MKAHQSQLQAATELAIPNTKSAWQYIEQLNNIFGCRVVVAPYGSFASRGYMNTREFLGWVKTAGGGSVGVWESKTIAAKDKQAA